MEGEVRFQVGDRRLRLGPGESILAPRRIPHTFSASGSPAHMLIAFTPADKMEQYFNDAAAHPELAPTKDFMNQYDMQWMGPSPFWKPVTGVHSVPCSLFLVPCPDCRLSAILPP